MRYRKLKRNYGHGDGGVPDRRGNSYDRAARRAWLFKTFGNGKTCPCFACGRKLDKKTMTVDRIKPGHKGGTYRRKNCRPACGKCNTTRYHHEAGHEGDFDDFFDGIQKNPSRRYRRITRARRRYAHA